MVTGREATVACLVSSGIATGFVGLRIYTRFKISRHPGWDDAVIVIADVFAIALCPIYLYRKFIERLFSRVITSKLTRSRAQVWNGQANRDP